MIKRNIVPVVLCLAISSGAWASRIEAIPSTFDFGWCPPKAKVWCEFTLKNTSEDIVSLTALLPSCGCTAAQFKPQELASEEETVVGLTFNTRGYDGRSFRKLARLKAADADAETSVTLTGHVTDPNATLIPDGTGIAQFTPEATSKTTTIALRNLAQNELKLKIVQNPAEWAEVELATASVRAGGAAFVRLSVNGPLDQTRHTSLTIEGTGQDRSHRVTLAIRTGIPPAPRHQIKPAPSGRLKKRGSPSTEE